MTITNRLPYPHLFAESKHTEFGDSTSGISSVLTVRVLLVSSHTDSENIALYLASLHTTFYTDFVPQFDSKSPNFFHMGTFGGIRTLNQAGH
ncbi:hypothetical protein TNCV_1590431 [Trichonephila clavipes]|nr:hypothetical protein TNCV_1590431 [Trichonephila clavipes]